MKKKMIAAVASALLAAPAFADFVVDVDLGILGAGSHSITGDTTGAGNEGGNYPPFTNPAVTWIEDLVYQFTTTQTLTYTLLNNAIAGDADFFLMDSLGTTFDGTQNAADSVLAADFLDFGADGASLEISPGTYYLSVDAFGGTFPGDSSANVGAFDVTLDLAAPDIVSMLGNLPLDDGFYARGGAGSADHPWGVMTLEVDTTGLYDIQGDWLNPAGGAFDGYLYLFDSPFAGDDSTAIALDDDFGGTAASRIENVALTAGTTYYLVGTTFGGQAGVEGLSGDITVSGPGNAIPEPGTLGLALFGATMLLRRRCA